ncbi:hypothetical protein ACWD4B_15880 [Streptomyces sp. NPDC002536]
MTEHYREHHLRMISASGLTILDTPAPGGVPSTAEAWSEVVNFETVPSATVSQGSADALSEVDEKWLTLAMNNALVATDGTFLINTAGPGTREVGWTVVKWAENARLASNLQYGGDPEFVAMSMDGRNMCAVTTEEYDYWIVSQRFD